MSSHHAPRSVIVSMLVLGALVVMDSPVPSAAANSNTASSNTVTVAISSLTPAVAVKGSTLKLSGNVTAGSVDHSDVTIRLAVADLQVRSDMGSKAGVGSQLVYGYGDPVGSLSAGSTTQWSLSMPVSALSPISQSIYALDIGAYSDGERIGVVRTYLPYAMVGDSSFHATQMVVLWPVTAAPALDGASDKDVHEAANDNLSAQFGPTGRLTKMLTTAAAAENVTVSWAVDPDLLATANTESHGYSLYPNGTPGTGAQNAASWLAEARAVFSGTGPGGPGPNSTPPNSADELWQLPAADPDLGSLARANPLLSSSMVTSAAKQTGTTITDLTGRTPKGTLAWPADGQVDSRTLNLAKTLNPSAVIARSDSVNMHTPLESYTPTGRASVDGDQLAVSDASLDAIFAGDPADAASKGSDQSLLGSQRFLAESALIALERPNLRTPRTVMVTASRTVAPDPQLLTALGEASWVKTVGLSTLLATRPDAHAQVGTIERDPAATRSDLSTGQLFTTASISASLRALSTILTQPDPAIDLFTPAVLRTVSTAWRSSATAQAAFAGAVQSRLKTTMDLVSLVQKSDLTLSGKSGAIPFTVENRFSYPVRVGIRITTDHAGLTVQSITVQTVPQGSTTVNVHVSSAVSGTRVTVTAQLVTPDGANYGEPQSLQVTVSSIGSITLVIFGLSAALLVVAVGLRIYRGRRTRDPQATHDAIGASPGNAAAAKAEREQ